MGCDQRFIKVGWVGFLLTLATLLLGSFSPAQSQMQVVRSEILERINVDTYLQNRRLVEYHIKCLIYNGPCDRIGNEIKRLFNTFRHTGISTSECRICTNEQKQKLAKIARHWQTHYPQAWRDLKRHIN